MSSTKLSKSCTVEQYLKYKNEKNKNKILKLFMDRYVERYIDPVTSGHCKNGFAIMAASCLMIENFFCFQNGFEKTPHKKASKYFHDFFAESSALKEFSEIDFYRKIRCGILHQGETYDGWKIRRTDALIDKKSRIINANSFINYIQMEFESYVEKMQRSNFDSTEWKNLIKKFDSIVENCKVK